MLRMRSRHVDKTVKLYNIKLNYFITLSLDFVYLTSDVIKRYLEVIK